MRVRAKAKEVDGRRVYRVRCQSPDCPERVTAVATFRQRCAVPLSVRFELCESHTVLEILRHADGEWSGRISRIPVA